MGGDRDAVVAAARAPCAPARPPRPHAASVTGPRPRCPGTLRRRQSSHAHSSHARTCFYRHRGISRPGVLDDAAARPQDLPPGGERPSRTPPRVPVLPAPAVVVLAEVRVRLCPPEEAGRGVLSLLRDTSGR